MARRPLTVRGRRALGWGLALFFLGQLSLTLYIERSHPELRDAEEGSRLRRLRARRAEAPGRPLVIFLGSSRGAMGFRPQILPPLPKGKRGAPVVFNYSLVGGGPLTQLLCLERLAQHGIRPDAVLIEIWLPAFYGEEKRLRGSRCLQLSDLRLVSRYLPISRSQYRSCLTARLLPAYAHRLRLQSEWLRLGGSRVCQKEDLYWSTLDGSGWLPCPWNVRASADYGAFARKQRDGYVPVLQQFQPEAIADRALHDLLATCRERGIAAMLLLLPEASDFRGYYSAAAVAGRDTYVAALQRQYHVPAVDTSTWVADNGFADGYHLNPEGATCWTERLNREVLVPWLSSRLQHRTQARR